MNVGLSILVPIYNEQESVQESIEEIITSSETTSNFFEIILINDGSTDNTEATLQKIKNDNDQVDIIVINHNGNYGYGYSLKTGIQAAKFNYIAITDADGTYPNNRIMEFHNMVIENDLDMLVGARIGQNTNIPYIRKPAKWLLNIIANYLTGEKIPDLNSGFRIIKKEIVNKFIHILPDGFSFTTTITIAMLTKQYSVQFEKINYLKRLGKSKIRPIYDTLTFFMLIIKTVIFFKPLKIFLPLSGIMFLIGLIMLGIRFVFGGGLGVVSTIIIISSVQILAVGMLADLIEKKL